MRIIPIKGKITRFCTSQSHLTAINAFNKPGNFTGFVAEGILGNSNKDYQLSVALYQLHHQTQLCIAWYSIREGVKNQHYQ